MMHLVPRALHPTAQKALLELGLMIFSGRPFSTCSTCLRINSKANGLVDHGLHWTQTDIEPLMGEAYQPPLTLLGPSPAGPGGGWPGSCGHPGPGGR